MTQEKILEGNKLIAEFMEISIAGDCLVCDFPHPFITRHNVIVEFMDGKLDCDVEEMLEFHLSFDWIMPCVHKIASMHLNDEVTTLPLFTPIYDIFRAVIAFIKWHNSIGNQTIRQQA